MFIETLEFTIPIELCSVFTSLQKGSRTNVEFPASVNSYGTTQDANVQVLLRSNKVTFKVDGVSSNSSMISKSECKTLKLSVFDVDRSLMPQEEEEFNNSNSYDIAQPSMQESEPIPIPPLKRRREENTYTPNKSIRTSLPERTSLPDRTSLPEPQKPRSPPHRRPHNRPPSNDNQTTHSEVRLNVKEEPEDPDLIEIEPDLEPDDVVPKSEMQIDYSSDIPHTSQVPSQAVLDRLSYNQHASNSPGSSSSSFHQNVPHVPDYAEPGPSHHGNQSADDYLVFQDEDGDHNDGDYSNDDNVRLQAHDGQVDYVAKQSQFIGTYPCPKCERVFKNHPARLYHTETVHDGAIFICICQKVYKYRTGLQRHQKSCRDYLELQLIKCSI